LYFKYSPTLIVSLCAWAIRKKMKDCSHLVYPKPDKWIFCGRRVTRRRKQRRRRRWSNYFDAV